MATRKRNVTHNYRPRHYQSGGGCLGTLLLLPLLFWMWLLEEFSIDFCAIAVVLAGLTYLGLGYGAYVAVA